MSNSPNPADYILKFSDSELEMLGRTADALSAYMGCVVLAEIGVSEDTEWVIFGRAIGLDEESSEDLLHVQMGGSGSRILGQKGGIETTAETLDCEFLWAIEITDDPDERYVRLDQEGEVFDSASELVTLLPFSLQEPVQAAAMSDDEDPEDDPGNSDEDRDVEGPDESQRDGKDGTNGTTGMPPTLH
ncbi:hypothetical protein [Orrella marina]|uniref:Uncharacterized protein n=1 Tax=Orrella marina TaxID=2163011 RepID=A0A2R4XNG0_9BURK|nr:hypothetical protein [Orrella marina]AWB35343.1 hypothetical protein DBV39_18150 [Orrella marina]